MKDKVVMVFGDSITYGLYDDELNGWVNRIRNKLEKDNYFVFNLGIPGQSSIDLKNRFELEIKNRYNNEDDFIIIYAIGIKDALKLNDDIKNLNIFEDNIKYIINITKKYSKQIYFLSLIEPDYKKRTMYLKENVYLINNKLKELSLNNSENYIDVFNILDNINLIDGLHPDSKGNKLISLEVLEKLTNSK